MSVTSWSPQTSMSSQHSPMSVSTQSVRGHCHPTHVPPVHVASMVSDSVRCPRTLHVRAASLSSYSQDIFNSCPTVSGVQGHCMSVPSLTGPRGVLSCLEVRPKRPATPRPKTCQVHGQGQTWPGHPWDLPLFSECTSPVWTLALQLMTVRTGEMLMRAGAILSPCIAKPIFSSGTRM